MDQSLFSTRFSQQVLLPCAFAECPHSVFSQHFPFHYRVLFYIIDFSLSLSLSRLINFSLSGDVCSFSPFVLHIPHDSEVPQSFFNGCCCCSILQLRRSSGQSRSFRLPNCSPNLSFSLSLSALFRSSIFSLQSMPCLAMPVVFFLCFFFFRC